MDDVKGTDRTRALDGGAEAQPVLPAKVLEKYVIEDRIGKGGMGSIFRARQLPLGRTVAVKVIRTDRTDPDAVARFRREAEILGGISHPHVVTLLDFDALDDGSFFCVMDLLDGGDLGIALRGGRLATSDAVVIAHDVASALEALHVRGVVHRDLKPANIFLVDGAGRTPFARLLDFGIAKRSVDDGQTADQTLTGVGAMVGTPGYIAPETALRGEAGPAVDVYALGVVLFEMLTGTAPFDAATPLALIVTHATNVAPDVRSRRPEVSAALAALVEKMLAKDPVLRPNATECVAALDRSLAASVEQFSVSGRDQPAATDLAHLSPLIDPEARRHYSRGKQLWEKRTPPAVQEAIGCFQAAIDRDPAFADAYAGMANASTYLAFLEFVSPRIALARARAAGVRSLEFGPNNSDVLATLGFISALCDWDWSGATTWFTRAFSVNGTHALAHHWYGLLLSMRREIAEARVHMRRAFELDPLSPMIALSPQFAEYYAGNFAGAIRWCRDVVESEPSFAAARYYLGRAHEAVGDLDAAVEAYRAATDLVPVEMEGLPCLVSCLYQTGRRQEAEAFEHRLTAAEGRRYISPFFRAIVASGKRDRDATLRSLRDAVEDRATRIVELHVDPRFEWLHDDEEFRALVERIGYAPLGTLSPA